KEWPEMAQQRTTLATLPTALIEALHDTLALKPADDSERVAQAEMVKELHIAFDARRQRIVVSEYALGTVKWAAILLQALCTLVDVPMFHRDIRLARAISLTLYATGIALSVLLIAAYSHPFNSVGPSLLKQVTVSEVPFGGGSAIEKSRGGLGVFWWVLRCGLAPRITFNSLVAKNLWRGGGVWTHGTVTRTTVFEFYDSHVGLCRSVAKRVLLFAISQPIIPTCDAQCRSVPRSWFAIWFANFCPSTSSERATPPMPARTTGYLQSS